MYRYRSYCVVNGQDTEQVKQALDDFSARVLSLTSAQVDFRYDLITVSQKDTYSLLRPDFGGWGVSYPTLNKYNTDAVGFHSIRYFYRPDGIPSSFYAFTYPLQGRVQMQLPIQTFTDGVADASQILSRMTHEFFHECFQNLDLKGVHLSDTTDEGDKNDFSNELATLSPYWEKICSPLPVDTWIGQLLAQITRLKQQIWVAQSYNAFRAKWLGKSVDYDKNGQFWCVDLYRAYCSELGITQSPPVVSAKDLWNFDAPDTVKIGYAPGLYPVKGDIVVFNMPPDGHVAICDMGNAQTFCSLDQNWGKPYVRLVSHGYENVIGWMRKI